MAPLDTLPADQRAVLSLVLERGKGYDEIARMLSIDRTSVRERALAALDALGPQTQVSDLRRALITDYLLGQLSPAVAQETRDRLADTPSERAWARVLASELAPLSSEPLPEIPAAGAAAPAPIPIPTSPASGNGEPDGPVAAPVIPAAAPAGADNAAAATALGASPPDQNQPRSSRLGGIILLAGGAIVAIAVVLVIVLTSGGSASSHKSSPAAAASSSTTPSGAAAGSSTTSTTGSGTTPTVVAQINLKPPSGAGSAVGIAEVLKEGAKKGIAIVAQHMTPNSHKPPNAYAVWLYNSGSDATLLGFVNPGVGKNGRLSTAGGLPTNAAHFHKLIITLETKANPKAPGTIVLSGPLSGT